MREAATADPHRQTTLDHAFTWLRESIEELEVRNEELRRAMADLDAERRRYRELFDMAADGYLITDAREVIVEANRSAGRLMARPAESLLGRRMGDLLDGGRGELARRVRQARPGSAGEAVAELAVRGRGRLVRARYRVTEDPRGGEARTHWTLTDLEGPIFETEAATPDGAVAARRWLGIYRDLVAVAEDQLEDAAGRTDGLSRPARAHLTSTQVRPLEAHIARLRKRCEYWSRRHAREVGLELSPETGVARYRDRTVPMTRREQQLLRFLADRPGTFSSSRVLLSRAWQASYLSEEQVRTYVGRVRRKLTELQLPCELVTQRPQGYALVFAEGDGKVPSPSPV